MISEIGHESMVSVFNRDTVNKKSLWKITVKEEALRA